MKKIILVLLGLTVCGFASVIGLDALGEEQVAGGMASTAGRGYAGGAKTGDAEGLSVLNPARNAFDTKVVFNVNFLMDMVALEKKSDNFVVNNISMPSFNLSFPMGGFGAFGVSLWQSYSSNVDEDVMKHSSLGILSHRDGKTTLQHILKQSNGLQTNTLATRVGTTDD